MRYRIKKTGQEETPIGELLEFTNKDIPYDKDKERDKQSSMKEELEQRYPFADFKRQIDNLNHQVNELRDAVAKLSQHTHTDGKVVVDIKESMRGIFF